MVRGAIRALFFVLALGHSCAAFAQATEPEGPPRPPPPAAPEPDYHTPRYEAAGFPLIAGNSDVGVKTGAAATLKRFEDGVSPYRWNVDLLLAASFKRGPTAIEVAQQSYLLNFELVGLADGKVRSGSSARYSRTINQLYFGRGNASSSQLPASAGEPGRYFQFIAPELEVRQLTRIRLHRPLDAMITTIYRYESPETYPGSKLEQDGGAARVLGLHSMSLVSLGGGLLYDTRDNEPFPSKGMLHKVGAKHVQGFPIADDVRYGQVGGFFAGYVPLGGFVYAARVVVDLQFGNVPFFDLYRAGPFESYEMIGGSTGIRGVPVGRYLGPIKVLANQEVRAMLAKFQLLGQNFRLGGNVLFDVGRLWSDYSFRAPEDGSGIGLRWGAGGGLYVGWGQASIFRIEAAYATEAVAANPSFPIGFYVNDGVGF